MVPSAEGLGALMVTHAVRNAPAEVAARAAGAAVKGAGISARHAALAKGARLPADLAPFATVKIDESWLNTSIDAGKLDYMEAAWFGLDPAQTGVGQSELWVRIKSNNK